MKKLSSWFVLERQFDLYEELEGELDSILGFPPEQPLQKHYHFSDRKLLFLAMNMNLGNTNPAKRFCMFSCVFELQLHQRSDELNSRVFESYKKYANDTYLYRMNHTILNATRELFVNENLH
jgi:hypothetical protein